MSATNTAKDLRSAQRKQVDYILVTEITDLDCYALVAREAYIVDVSSDGFLVKITRQHLEDENLKNNLSLEDLEGKTLALYLPDMGVDLDGTVVRTQHVGRGVFEMALKFSEDTPKYWRECLVDLLPSLGEI